ncbi:multidrug ABC transporter ATP-binding protein, partial [Marinomonas sp. 42_23_T18]
MLSFFEKWTQPFPDDEPSQPPRGLIAFCRHYTKGFGLPLIVMSLLTALLAILEVILFDFMGKLVDWLSTKTPETFIQQEGMSLVYMSLMLLVALPIVVFIHSCVVHQTLM